MSKNTTFFHSSKSIILLNSITRSFRKGRGAYSNDDAIQEGVLPMITTNGQGRGGAQNSLKSDDVYVKDYLLYYTGEKIYFLSTVYGK